ncbi:type VII secretion protein EccB [Corynebacterium qintianiae]|uniref:Type VII secretion protein EccB n=1 Tax=Corynebacterium qintianiae TaxID=2709392 RepID=A0A7T0KP00_9CORY|nr:type VII secretion protein EccB [Corynebacterium qintianiae]QPK83569.1 type VII secretion protein EccB [Corynebacterium qintianiae]
MSAQPPRRLLPTTRSQVSGHRFMRRRVEHGLIFGDIRMIHDPLASRQRATIFSGVAVALVAAIMALFAWLRPNADPGDAPILRASSGELYIRVDGVVHPVTNLTSARLIAGAPEQAQRIGDSNLLELPRGVPVGIVNAPSVFAPRGSADVAWSACTPSDQVAVFAGAPAVPLEGAASILASADGREWLVDGRGRSLLPAADSPEGRIIRRKLGIDSDTPRWNPPSQVLDAIVEQAPLAIPEPLPEIAVNGTDSWALSGQGGVQSLSRVQREILLEAGAPRRDIAGSELAALPDADPPLEIHLPDRVPQWVDPESGAFCASENRVAAIMPEPAPSMALSGGAVATQFAGLDDGAVAVDTGHGFHVVSANGVRHPVSDRGALDVIGAEHIEHVPWEIISLLPEGPALTQLDALTATY